MSKRDYYEILGLAKNATDDDIKKAYRKMASKYHPDKVQGDDEKTKVEEKFKEVNEAYDTLGDPEKKSAYDNYGHEGANPFMHQSGHRRTHTWNFDPSDPHGMHTIFEEIFRSNPGGGFTRNNSQPIVILNISLKDAYTGKMVRYDSKATLNIPSGVRPGTKLYVDGRLFKIEIQPDTKFKRALDDLMVEVSIDAIEAMLGVEAVLDHLDGTRFQFNIPAGIQSGQIVKLSKKGMKNPETSSLGDLLIRVSVSIPKNLSEKDRESIKVLPHRDSITI